MALSTYADLLTAVQAYEDDTSTVVTDRLADFVTLAEQRIFMGNGDPGSSLYSPALRCRAMEKTMVFPIGPGQDGGTSAGSANDQTVTLATVPTITRGLKITFIAGYSNTGAMTLNPNALGGVNIRKGRSQDALEQGDVFAGGTYTVCHDGTYFILLPSDGAIPQPSRFLGVKGAYLQDRGRILSPMPATGINIWMDGATAGEPEYYAIQGDCIRFDPLPNDDYKLSMNYYARPSALSTSLNDIFRESPGIYLYGTLLELAIYLPNPDKITQYYGEFIAAIRAYSRSDSMAVQGHAPMRVRLGIAP